jgi:predicted amidohydrolase
MRTVISLAQIGMDEDPRRNLDKTLVSMEQAASEGARLIVFPESQFSPYFPQFADRDAGRYLLTESSDLVRAMRDRCRALGLVATANVYLAEGAGRFSATIVIDRDGAMLGVSKKVHITSTPMFYEQDYFSSGDEGFVVYETSAGRFGVVICYDRHYPESIRSCALQGAELILVPTANTVAEDAEMFEWEMRVSAFQNNVYIAMCNRVGVEAAMAFAGRSIVVDPDGRLVARLDEVERIVCVEIDTRLVHESREARPYLKLRSQGLPDLARWNSLPEREG